MDNTQTRSNRKKTAILLVDWDNFAVNARKADLVPRARAITEALISKGFCVERQSIYAHASSMDPALKTALHADGFRIIDCPKIRGRGALKDTVDFVIIDDLRWLAKSADVDAIALASQDKDFVTASNDVRNHGKMFVVAQ